MTNIIVKTENGNIIGFVCKKHAGFAESGKDIVCAGVSSITQTAVLGIKNIAKADCWCKIDQNDGLIDLKLINYNLNSSCFHDAQVILSTMICGLEDLMKQYPKYIKLEVK